MLVTQVLADIALNRLHEATSSNNVSGNPFKQPYSATQVLSELHRPVVMRSIYRKVLYMKALRTRRTHIVNVLIDGEHVATFGAKNMLPQITEFSVVVFAS
jgi:hypothetical protein